MATLNNKDTIQITGAKENNLKDISIEIPKDKLVLFTGVSGSGKSSLVFDTIATEAKRLWQDSYPLYVRNQLPHYERPNVDTIENLTPSIVVDQRQIGDNSRSTVGSIIDVEPLIRLLFSRVGVPSAGFSMAYNAHNPLGMCPVCKGAGKIIELDESKMFDMNKSFNEGGVRFSQFKGGWMARFWRDNPLLDPNKKLKDYTPEEMKVLKYGPDKPLNITEYSNNTGQATTMPYEGVIPKFNRLYINKDINKMRKSLRDEILSLCKTTPCKTCHGTGLNPKVLESKINGKNIWDINNTEINDLPAFFKSVEGKFGKSLANQIMTTINRMINVGLGYLTLDRQAGTVSGGEGQRLKMVKHIGTALNNITYIFDEPTAGLHPDDANKIATLLKELRDKVNSVLVVEHSRLMIETADQVIEIGPWSGENGGRIDFQGTIEELKKTNTITAQALNEKVVLNAHPRKAKGSYPIKDATLHNLKDLSVDIPKGVLTAVTGVAGSGKSTLITQEFMKKYPQAILISQKAIGTSNRSTPATYSGISDIIRDLFAKANKVSNAWFSFNSKGACPECKGKGYIIPDVAFADSVQITCDLCGGKRYNEKALSYKYRDKSIWDVMNMTIEEASEFFNDPEITKRLQSLVDVGLGYMTLNQQTSTLSGGENQRLKLASELYKKGNIYVLDEPTTGLSNWDIKKLIVIFNRLVDDGNTVIIIEHRLQMIAQADWIIDMGPHGGNEGGKIIFTGTPEDLVKCKQSLTAEYMKKVI